MSERRGYVRQMQPQYRSATKAEKKGLLDEMKRVTGMHRKSLTRLVNADDVRPKSPRRRARRRKYGADVEHVVGLVWESLDGICAERLTPAIRTTAEHLEQFGEVRGLRTERSSTSIGQPVHRLLLSLSQ